VTAGGSEAVSMAIAIACDPGDEIIVPEPYYTNYNTFALLNQVTIVPYPTRLEDNFALNDLSKLEALVTEKTKAILICTPNNPTGAVLSREEMEIVCDVAKRHHLFVISDEVYREFAYDGAVATSVLAIDGMDDLGIVIDSVSKRYSVCGARVGWIASRNADVISTALKFGQSRLSVATLEQVACVELLKKARKTSRVRRTNTMRAANWFIRR
jgi:aspartate aminotransferase